MEIHLQRADLKRSLKYYRFTFFLALLKSSCQSYRFYCRRRITTVDLQHNGLWFECFWRILGSKGLGAESDFCPIFTVMKVFWLHFRPKQLLWSSNFCSLILSRIYILTKQTEIIGLLYLEVAWKLVVRNSRSVSVLYSQYWQWSHIFKCWFQRNIASRAF